MSPPARSLPAAEPPHLPASGPALRALREARGISRDGWAARLGYGHTTVQRWEQGETVPDARAEAALLELCRDLDLFGPYQQGPLAGVTLTPDVLRQILVRARLPASTPPPVRADLRPLPPVRLPAELTSFLGRDRERGAVARLLETGRLVTLSGPGGVGKTRLAVAVARDLQAAYPQGVYFVSLEALSDPALVAAAIAQAVGVTDASDQPLVESLCLALRNRTLLLVLDNFEQVVDAAPLVVTLLAACPTLSALVTSRTVLRVSGEQEYLVEPLPLPEADLRPRPGDDTRDAVAGCTAVDLFVERARAARPSFELTAENAGAVAAICRRLDGLPLAIELAAAHVRVLPPGALLGQLARGLDVLARGPRDRPARQQTLRATIAWSHDLLAEAERVLFRRLAVFAGGWTLASAEHVCNPDGQLDVLDGLTTLTEHSLVRPQAPVAGEPRYTMLMTIREFAQERLAAAASEAVPLRERLAEQIAVLAEEAEPRLPSAERAPWLARLRAEQENVRAALLYGTEAEPETGARIAAALAEYWWFTGRISEGRRWADAALTATAAAQRTPLRAKVLWAAGMLAWVQDDHRCAWPLLEESAAIWLELGQTGRAARSLGVGSAALAGAGRPSASVAAEAVTLARRSGDAWLLGYVLNDQGIVLATLCDEAAAARAYAESAALYQALGDPFRGTPLGNLGLLAARRGDLAQARTLLEESLPLARETNDVKLVAYASLALARVAEQQGDLDTAAAGYADALTSFQEMGNRLGTLDALTARALLLRWHDQRLAGPPLREALQLALDLKRTGRIVPCLDGSALLAAGAGKPEDAVRLMGAAAALRASRGMPIAPQYRGFYEESLATLRHGLGAARFAAAWSLGETLTLDDAIALACDALAGVHASYAVTVRGAGRQPRQSSAPG